MEPKDFNRFFSEINPSPEEDFVDISQVRSLQSLAMGVFKEIARREVQKHKMTGFVLLDRAEGNMGSGGVDTYMGVISRRPSHDYWQFTTSFLSYQMEDKLRYCNYREIYRYNWNSSGKCVGTKIVIDNHNPVISTRVDEDLGHVDTVEPNVESLWYPLTDEDTIELRQRMLATVSNVEYARPKNRRADWKAMEDSFRE